MPIECRRSTSGGKGNRSMFIERDPNIVAAGIPTAQQGEVVGDSLKHYLLQEQAEALISDAIIPTPKQRQCPPLRKPIPLDMRFAGIFGHVAKTVNPPKKSKFQTVVADFKETSYKSYWKTPLGHVQDPAPMLPAGFDKAKTFGKSTVSRERLYDIVMPKDPYPDKTALSKDAGAQINRNYCVPAYNPELTYGYRTFVDKRGTYARCCFTDDNIILGSSNKVMLNYVQSNVIEAKRPKLGLVQAPNNNISEVPPGHSFGKLAKPDNLPQCLTSCEINQGLSFFRQCMKHLNTVRCGLSARFLPSFFTTFYLSLKYQDTERTGWLFKDIVYTCCRTKLVRFDNTLIEPLLTMWNAFDGSKIEYKTLVHILNYREPSPEMPKIPDLQPDCLDYRTTYREMVKPGQMADNRQMAGLPSGRYFDLDYPISPERCCAADRICLLQESDMKSCISPSVLTKLFVTHRDMYQKQEPSKVRRVFEAAGENISDEQFDTIWKEAQKLHSQGWVCYETFRRALEKYSNSKT